MVVDLGPYFATFVSLLRLLIHGGPASTAGVAPDGTRLTMRRSDLEPGRWLLLTTQGDEPELPFGHAFAPASARPEAFPAQLPFIPNAEVAVLSIDPVAAVLWPTPADGTRLTRSVTTASQTDGWTLTDSSPRDSPDPFRHAAILHRATHRRIILTIDVESAPALLLIEQRPG